MLVLNCYCVPFPELKAECGNFLGFREKKPERLRIPKINSAMLAMQTVPYSGNTTNLMYHLQTAHPAEHKEIAQSKCDGRLTENAEKYFWLLIIIVIIIVIAIV